MLAYGVYIWYVSRHQGGGHPNQIQNGNLQSLQTLSELSQSLLEDWAYLYQTDLSTIRQILYFGSSSFKKYKNLRMFSFPSSTSLDKNYKVFLFNFPGNVVQTILVRSYWIIMTLGHSSSFLPFSALQDGHWCWCSWAECGFCH